MVKQTTYLSDHSQIAAWFSTQRIFLLNGTEKGQTSKSKAITIQYIWTKSSSTLFKNEFNSQYVMKLVNNVLRQDFKGQSAAKNSLK